MYDAPKYECCIIWNDPAIGIQWPCDGMPILSGKDRQGSTFEQAEWFE
jgi:dTDP-4-dehydrorhamnose 3,5-epimerase